MELGAVGAELDSKIEEKYWKEGINHGIHFNTSKALLT